MVVLVVSGYADHVHTLLLVYDAVHLGGFLCFFLFFFVWLQYLPAKIGAGIVFTTVESHYNIFQFNEQSLIKKQFYQPKLLVQCIVLYIFYLL